MEYLLCMFWSCGTAKQIEPDSEPSVNVVVELEVFVANFSRRRFFFRSLGFSSCSIFVSATV